MKGLGSMGLGLGFQGFGVRVTPGILANPNLFTLCLFAVAGFNPRYPTHHKLLFGILHTMLGILHHHELLGW